ncbi:hypothetical protein BaRGS_00040371 [Batillaria attramentaria]|uniref:Uncharacterized protein n=1 Tax=Batillaria attramentaria TaxID=370345 RepID=A0ABD0J0C0_9CAEN
MRSISERSNTFQQRRLRAFTDSEGWVTLADSLPPTRGRAKVGRHGFMAKSTLMHAQFGFRARADFDVNAS